MSTHSSVFPSATDERNFALDVLRGIALFGILFISIRDFGGFTPNEQIRYITSPSHGGNYKLLTLVSLLFEGKMTGLLAMIIAAGLVLFLQKKEHPVAIDNADALIRQQIWLMIFGLITAFIILWPNEVLFPFGVVAIMLFAFWKLPAKSLFIASLICTLVFCGKNYWAYAEDKDDYQKYVAVTVIEKKFKADSSVRAQDSIKITKDTTNLKAKLVKLKLTDSLAKKKDTLTARQAEEKGKWEGVLKSQKYDSMKTVKQNKTMRGGYSKVWFALKGKAQHNESTWLYSIGLWEISAMMFLGMALLGIGFFHRRFSTANYLLAALLLIAAGGALGLYRLHNNDLHWLDYSKFISSHSVPHDLFLPFEQLLMAAGYASLVMALIRVKILQWLWKGMAAVGHMTLSNYILQTFACAFVFYGYGLGYYGRYEQWELYFLVAEIILIQVVFSVFWMRTYTTGPLEWALKCLVYWKKNAA